MDQIATQVTRLCSISIVVCIVAQAQVLSGLGVSQTKIQLWSQRGVIRDSVWGELVCPGFLVMCFIKTDYLGA